MYIIAYLVCLIFIIYLLKPMICTDTSNIKVILFFRPGCPHCDDIKSAWNELKNSSSSYEFVEINTALPENKKICEYFAATGVPHIVLSLSNGFYKIYSGNRELSDMKTWIKNK